MAPASVRLVDAESVLRTDREAERCALREAAARAVGLDGPAIRQLLDDIRSIARSAEVNANEQR